MTTIDPQLLYRALLQASREDFFSFVAKTFEILHTSADASFVPAWHVEAMCHELENIRTGENKRLVINIPPRCLKSITVAVAYTAFLLGHNPSTTIIVASYGMDLARKHSEDCRRVMSSRWYQDVFPDTRLAAKGNTLDEIKTTQGGSRKSVSIGSAVTGHGADYVIIDDLMKAGDAASETELEMRRISSRAPCCLALTTHRKVVWSWSPSASTKSTRRVTFWTKAHTGTSTFPQLRKRMPSFPSATENTIIGSG